MENKALIPNYDTGVYSLPDCVMTIRYKDQLTEAGSTPARCAGNCCCHLAQQQQQQQHVYNQQCDTAEQGDCNNKQFVSDRQEVDLDESVEYGRETEPLYTYDNPEAHCRTPGGGQCYSYRRASVAEPPWTCPRYDRAGPAGQVRQTSTCYNPTDQGPFECPACEFLRRTVYTPRGQALLGPSDRGAGGEAENGRALRERAQAITRSRSVISKTTLMMKMVQCQAGAVHHGNATERSGVMMNQGLHSPLPRADDVISSISPVHLGPRKPGGEHGELNRVIDTHGNSQPTAGPINRLRLMKSYPGSHRVSVPNNWTYPSNWSADGGQDQLQNESCPPDCPCRDVRPTPERPQASPHDQPPRYSREMGRRFLAELKAAQKAIVSLTEKALSSKQQARPKDCRHAVSDQSGGYQYDRCNVSSDVRDLMVQYSPGYHSQADNTRVEEQNGGISECSTCEAVVTPAAGLYIGEQSCEMILPVPLTGNPGHNAPGSETDFVFVNEAGGDGVPDMDGESHGDRCCDGIDMMRSQSSSDSSQSSESDSAELPDGGNSSEEAGELVLTYFSGFEERYPLLLSCTFL